MMSKVRRGWAVGRDAPADGEVHLDDFVVLGEGELAIFGLEGVDMDGSIGGLRGDVFIEGIPSHALDVVIMLCNLADRLT